MPLYSTGRGKQSAKRARVSSSRPNDSLSEIYFPFNANSTPQSDFFGCHWQSSLVADGKTTNYRPKHDQITLSTAVSIVIELLLMRSALLLKPNPLKSSCVDESVKRDSAFQTPASGGHPAKVSRNLIVDDVNSRKFQLRIHFKKFSIFRVDISF